MTTTSKAIEANAATTTQSKWLPVRADVLALFAALVALYVPTVWNLFTDGDAALWSKGEHSHGPFMAAVAAWLMTVRWREFTAAHGEPNPGNTWLAWPLLAFGSALFIVGRALGIIYAEVGSFIPMLMGVVLIIGGTKLLNQL
ncbi:MAG TPA: archaeosortase/exosortase family protein, partial [Aquabacterium sp.]|nr:archaeosortase/exosortase family protein [Aquabacterium sp.]